MQNVLITGAEGFAGTALTKLLTASGCSVTGGVRNRARKLAFEKQFGKALVCDVSDAINVARVVASVKPGAIVHLAGASSAAIADEDPLTAYQSVVSGWANILDAVRRSVPRCRVLMISGAEVYGAACDGSPVGEDARPQPCTTLGSMKETAESIARTFHKNYHLDVMIGRPFSYTGPNQSASFFFGSVATKLAHWDQSINGDELRLPDLNCRRDVLHVDDVVSAYETLLKNGQPNQAYNVCSGQSTAVRDIVQWMVSATGRSIRIAEQSTDGGSNPGTNICGNNQKLCSLGWSARHTVQQAAEQLLASCRTAAPANIHA
ncbi:GDP-6-deoxy-D-mannose reductase [Phycisphaerae bacterium RAS1]|nr:GDP-6-deoxy-D-mannose reductase [Phycisphaerae bacterium RAS1]